MKTIQCEICGCQEIVKEDNFFVCQSCGAKYTLAQAKKMLLTENMPQNNKTSNIENLRNMARRALEAQDYENVEKYYEELNKSTFNDWEAVFYRLFGRAMKIEFEELDKTIILVNNSLNGIEQVVSKYTDKIERAKIVTAISTGIMDICANFSSIASDIYDNGLEKRDYYRNGITDYESLSEYQRKDYTKRLDEIGKICLIWGEIQITLMDSYLNDEQKKKLYTSVLDIGILIFLKSFIYKLILDIRQIDEELLNSLKYYCGLIKKYNPSYKDPFSSQDEFNRQRAKIQKEQNGNDWDPIVFDADTKREMPYSKWLNKKAATNEAIKTTPPQQSQPKETSKTVKVLMGIVGGIIFGLIYISCLGG